MAETTFTGNLGSDAELRFSQSGQPVLNFNVCDSKSRKDDNGNWQTIAEQWFRVSVWGTYAEYLAEHLVRGTRVTVWGEFYQREYEHNGEKRTSLDVNAHGVRILQQKPKQQQTRPAHQDDPWAAQQSAAPF
jgi:single-strand DNA-binding protein